MPVSLPRVRIKITTSPRDDGDAKPSIHEIECDLNKVGAHLTFEIADGRGKVSTLNISPHVNISTADSKYPWFDVWATSTLGSRDIFNGDVFATMHLSPQRELENANAAVLNEPGISVVSTSEDEDEENNDDDDNDYIEDEDEPERDEDSEDY
jgi:hypothetical protein